MSRREENMQVQANTSGNPEHSRTDYRNNESVAVGVSSEQYQDCLLCRLTGTAVFGLISIGAFKEAWRLNAEWKEAVNKGVGSAPHSSAQQPSARATQPFVQTMGGALRRFVSAMAVFPSEQPRNASHPASGSTQWPSNPSTKTLNFHKGSPRPTARIGFLVIAGVGFAGGAVWRAVMPAHKVVQR
ncbi:unnamed protein product [Jaminaea pallidilutea]